MYYVNVLALVGHVGLAAACMGGGGGGAYYYYNTYGSGGTNTINHTSSHTNKYTVLERNLPNAWGGFVVPPEVEAQWKSWLDEYKKRRKLEKKSGNTDEIKKAHGPGSGFPYAWQGYGAGHAGFPPEEPPPWAYKPYNIGFPAFCYSAPLKGDCKEVHTRWAHNPYSNECVEFQYSGCGGNENNFLTQLKCIETCMTTPPSGCDSETDIYVEDYVIKNTRDTRRRLSRKCGHDTGNL